MAKGQVRTNKEAKKPKKSNGPTKPITPAGLAPTITTAIVERGKKKK